ncbi:MAG: hypothetical protein OER80_09195 [Gammaproteobacteria bacterium]|nr:hypothetical protein [Gammaproteobacteria bacterium]MDH3767362.1 hypothetical protein [Gammaproteobacteria bacterium]
MNNTYIRVTVMLFILVMIVGCETLSYGQVLDAGNAVELRSYQTRAFDTTDKVQTLRTIIATMQDLSFVIDKADAELGSVSATRLDGYELRLTVTVRPRGDSQLLVRANAQWELVAVEEQQLYQDFFTSLEKSMFLAAHQVD